MNTRAIMLSAGLVALVSCSPAEKHPVAPTPTTAPAASAPVVEAAAPFVFYRMVQAGHVELAIEEVRLDTEASRCFQAHRRLFGGFSFDQGKEQLDRSAFAAEVEDVVKAWKDWTKQGKKPSLVLHGHAEHDEADTADAARALSVKRAEAVKAWLVESGLPAERLQVDGHGWDLSPAPLEPTDVLKPNRRVEISSDRTPPSEARLVEAKPVAADVLAQLQSKVRALEGKASPPADSLHAPRTVFVINDASGRMELAFDVASADPEAVALHRYFMQGLSNGCSFEQP